MTWEQFVYEECGYKTISTFWSDFTTADHYGVDAVQDTFNRAFKEWKGDYKMLTELVLVLNHKIWQHYERAGNTSNQFTRLYNNLWEQADNYAVNNLKDDELSYFLRTTD